MNKGFKNNNLKKMRKTRRLIELERLRTLLLVIQDEKEKSYIYVNRRERKSL